MNYYLAGYYLMRLLRERSWETLQNPMIYTCSDCLNDNLLDGGFARSWTCYGNSLELAVEEFGIDLLTLDRLQAWTEAADTAGKTGLFEVFYDANAAREYRQLFFSHGKDVKLLGLYLPEPELERLAHEDEQLTRKWEPDNNDFSNSQWLKKKHLPGKDETVLGYDLIGMSLHMNFHTFHCHGLSVELKEKFGVEMNEYGLIPDDSRWQELSAYMNDEKTAAEPVPWFFAQVRLVDVW